MVLTFDVGSPPGIDGLVRIPHHKEIAVKLAQGFHQLILNEVDILEFIDHNVFQPLLPLETDRLVLRKYI